MSYCAVAGDNPFHKAYHDKEYGFPVRDDRVLFERLMLEINQAGLSWITILKKREGFQEAYSGFDPALVAAYGDADRQRLLNDPRIVRNRLKVDAAVTNARKILELRDQHGSVADWLDLHHPQRIRDWARLFKRTFAFTGGEIVREFLVSTGYLPGAHIEECPIYSVVARAEPPWMRAPVIGG